LLCTSRTKVLVGELGLRDKCLAMSALVVMAPPHSAAALQGCLNRPAPAHPEDLAGWDPLLFRHAEGPTGATMLDKPESFPAGRCLRECARIGLFRLDCPLEGRRRTWHGRSPRSPELHCRLSEPCDQRRPDRR